MSRTVTLSAALCTLSILGADVAAQSYTFVPVSPPPGISGIDTMKLNAHADIVGMVSGPMASYTWIDGIAALFGVSQAILRDINDGGTVTGYRQQGSYQYAFRYNLNTGAISNLHTTTNCNYGRSVDPKAIANTGKIVGTRVASDCKLEAFQTSSLGVHGLGFLDSGRPDRTSEATAISDNGIWIAGNSRDTTGVIRAFLHSNGVMAGLRGGGLARAVNDSGIVVGHETNGYSPVRWDGLRNRRALALPSGMTQGVAVAINNSGVIAGDTSAGTYYRATAWSAAYQPHYVQDTTNATHAGWVPMWVTDINAAGYITVTASPANDPWGIRRQFLAIPDGPNPVTCMVDTTCLFHINPDACGLLGGSVAQVCSLPGDPGVVE